MRDDGLLWFTALMFMALFWLVMALTGARAEPEDGWRVIRKQFRVCDWTGCSYVHRNVRVYSYARRADDWDENRWRERGGRYDLCRPEEVDVLSTEHQSEDNAREAARKLWMAKVQWTIGGQYMDLDEAAHIRWRCGPSNAHDTASGRLAEAAGALTGKGGQNMRCALWARPCRVERKADDIRGRK